MEIRRLRAEDCTQAHELFGIAFYEDEYYTQHGIDITKDSIPEDFKRNIEYAINSGNSLGAFEDNELVAFILAFDYNKCKVTHPSEFDSIFGIKSHRTVWPYKDSIDTPITKLGDKVIYILSIAVLKDYRRLGIASELVMGVMDKNPEYAIVGDVSATESLPIYKRLGFRITEIEPDYNLVVLDSESV